MNSFASNGECGLKHFDHLHNLACVQFIRQQWRMWIETAPHAPVAPSFALNSFASNGECGLKRTVPE